MTALSVVNNTTIMRRLCTKKVLEGHSNNNHESYGDPEHSLNRVPRKNGEGDRLEGEALLSHLGKRTRFRWVRE
jgi:hypothetical protein